ncbi:response regulator transcription factor [Cupriavidus agavae]|uniref:Winged helix family two component transcriptional regulator n=1 Tax=Cupriavidus agavae TaxID=1001822 RepID=A0A4Q7RX15_9BURK|nr:response regulator transcription factor [Cupriavidus agavae]RZT38486.1 winged helix family two component transcriptional regulator [Cupriavidus agavae]
MAARADHECRTFSDGRRMLLTLRRVSFDLLLLEWRVAGMGGMEILEWARAHLDPRIPVMFLAAHDDEADIAAALGAGADDYMLKPIRPVELAARVGALLRRAYPDIGACGDSLITCGAFTFDVLARQATRHGAVITLTPKEFELALLLFRNEGRVVPREHMVLAIWGRDIPPMSRTIDTHISRVRNKLGLWDENGVRVQPVYTYGYRLERVDEHGQPVTRGRRGRVRAKKKAPEGAFPKIS